MLTSLTKLSSAAAGLALLSWSVPAATATPLSNIVTTYSVFNGNQITWFTCGATATEGGCFGSGALTNLPNVCSMMESRAEVLTNVAQTYAERRILYVVNAGATPSAAALSIYWKTDTVANGFVSTTMWLAKKIPLPVTGGAGVNCYMGANNAALFIGTSKGTTAVKVTLPGFAVSTLPGFSPATSVDQISASDTGYVTVNYASAGFYLFDPKGNVMEDGGGVALTPNAIQGLPLNVAKPAAPQTPVNLAATAGTP